MIEAGRDPLSPNFSNFVYHWNNKYIPVVFEFCIPLRVIDYVSQRLHVFHQLLENLSTHIFVEWAHFPLVHMQIKMGVSDSRTWSVSYEGVFKRSVPVKLGRAHETACVLKKWLTTHI